MLRKKCDPIVRRYGWGSIATHRPVCYKMLDSLAAGVGKGQLYGMKLEALIRDTLQLDPGTPITDADGPGTVTGWDSLGHVNIISSLESTFQVAISMDEMITLERVADIRKLLAEKGVVGA
jgi:acyl carrier protein